jgi:hypothetical protein
MRDTTGILAAACLVLTLLALLAGKEPGFMEDYHVVFFNTSRLGQNLIPTQTSRDNGASPTSCGGLGGTLGKLCASATAAVETAVSHGATDLTSIGNNISDKLAAKLGIEQWYSLHIMNVCEGSFTNPNTTRAGYRATHCTEPLQSGISCPSLL